MDLLCLNQNSQKGIDMGLNKQIEKIVQETFNLNDKKINENWTSDDIAEWDSMGHLKLIMAIEQEFKASIEIEEMFQIKCIGDIEKILEKKKIVIK